MHILVVEDDLDFQKIISYRLLKKSKEFKIDFANSASEGWSFLEKNKYDCMLLDYWLPDGNATELLLKFKSSNLVLPPIVVMTAQENQELGLKLVKLGIQDYLSKGEVTSSSLMRSISYSIERHKLRQELEKSKEHEHYMAYFDSLTSLPNRQSFFTRLKKMLHQARRSRQKLAVLFLDLDGFKKVNDGMGHAVGDRLLQMFANRLEKSVRSFDLVARVGGDEFTIVLSGVSESNEVALLVQGIQEKLEEEYVVNHFTYHLTCSIGISMYPMDGTHVNVLVKNADIAMYRAKNKGKHTFQFYDKKMETLAFERLALETSVRRALDNKEFTVFYQPQISLSKGRINGVEALIRWNHPELGLLGPDKFIGLAEESGLIIPMGELMMRESCQQVRIWQDQLGYPLSLSVNLSMVQFNDPHLIPTILNIVKETDFPPELLGLEITESCAASDFEKTKSILVELKTYGFKVLIDDFGTGYSSFGYLNSLPVDKLKIDHTFMQQIPNENGSSAIVSAILMMAEKLGLDVITEGVENKEQLNFVESFNCDEIQGYYFSRPVKAEDVEGYFKSFSLQTCV